MRLSRTLKSSAQSLPSPDGVHIATILSSKLHIRSTCSLGIARVINLPSELAASISWFLWSSNSIRILLGTTDYIRVYSTTDSKFNATIAHPVSVARATYVSFGANDEEVCVFTDFGLKVSIFNLRTSKSVDINSPKFYNPGVAAKGFSHRPQTSHLALLTRTGGKDVISVHVPDTLDVMRSWYPDTIDAQGVQWSPDGRWLVTWESASQGHRVLIYTADGHLFQSWNGPLPITGADIDADLGAGIKILEWSGNGKLLAIGDHSMRVVVLSMPSLSESIRLLQPSTVKPADSLQVWQEQLNGSKPSLLEKDFVLANQTIIPPTSNIPLNITEPKTGTNILTFDHSNTLLATKAEEMPTTLFIWDVMTRILRAALILHAPIAKVTWHPSIDEILIIRCEGDENRGLVHVWDPSWTAPKVLNFNAHIPGGKVLGKTTARWLNIGTQHPVIFFSDSQDYMLASLSSPVDGDLPWEETRPAIDVFGGIQESPLNLTAVSEAHGERRSSIDDMMENSFTGMSADSDELEDTFQFRKFVEPKDSPNSWT